MLSNEAEAEFNNCCITYLKDFQTLKGENELSVFLLTKNNNLVPRFLGQQFLKIICSGAAFLTSLVQYEKTFRIIVSSLVQYDKFLSKFGQQQLVMVNYVWF